MATPMRVPMTMALSAALGACGGAPERVAAGAAPVPVADPNVADVADWRRLATAADRERLRNWRQTWLGATGAVRGGDAAALAAEDGLFQPDRALADAVPPPGRYRCRVFKLGARTAGAPALVTYPRFDCRVDVRGAEVGFAKIGGSQRPAGTIFRDGPARAVFLGTMVLGDETAALPYGRDANRDMAGFVERIGERRWRIVLPEPRFESRLDVIDLVPAD